MIKIIISCICLRFPILSVFHNQTLKKVIKILIKEDTIYGLIKLEQND
jgi:hypothetical protein